MMFQLLNLLLISVIFTINALVSGDPEQFPQLTLRIHGQVGQHQGEIRKYTFNDDQKKARMSCVLNSTGNSNDGNYTYIVHFYINNTEKMIRTVTFQSGTTANISQTFKLHNNDKEVTCKAYRDREHFFDPLITRVRLYYRPPKERAVHEKLLNSTKWTPKVSPSVFNDSGEPIVMFSCTARGDKLALLSWYQMKGFDCVLLNTYEDFNETWVKVHSRLKITPDISDNDTEIFCAVCYFLTDGLNARLSDEAKSNRVYISINRTIGMKQEHDNNGFRSAVWLGIIGAVLCVSLIIMTGLLVALLRYRKMVKEFERDEHLKTRPPINVPYDQKPFGINKYVKESLVMAPDNMYEQVYSHGAGLKRPAKLRLTEGLAK